RFFHVTGVQACALPISTALTHHDLTHVWLPLKFVQAPVNWVQAPPSQQLAWNFSAQENQIQDWPFRPHLEYALSRIYEFSLGTKIGRASCREGVENMFA